MSDSYDLITTNMVKALALELGGDLVGFGPVERWMHAPKRLRPEAHLPGARSVIVVAIHHPDAVVELGGEPTPQDQGPYALQIDMNRKLDYISFNIARLLEERGYEALPKAGSNIWRYRPYKNIDTPFTADFSNRHAAVAAGLGELGWSGLLLTPEYGPRQRVVAIITDAPLEPTPMYDGPKLCDKCFECVRACPTDAFRKEVDCFHVVRIENKTFKYPRKNMWRCSWGEHWGLDLSLPIPEKVTEEVVFEMLKKHGRRGGEMGSCLRYCMTPQLRYRDPGYCRVYRRKKRFVDENHENASAEATQKVKGIAVKWGARKVGILSPDGFQNAPLKPEDYLPRARSVVLLGIDFPQPLGDSGTISSHIRESSQYMRNSAIYWLRFAALDICRYLDRLGYAAMPTWGRTSSLDKFAAEISGFVDSSETATTRTYGLKHYFVSVLTDAPLKPDPPRRTPDIKTVATIDRPVTKETFTKELKKEAARLGADLVGIAHFERLVHVVGFDELKKSLPSATSIIVLGLHYPDAAIERATEPPAESPASYSFVQYFTLRQLSYMAVSLSHYIYDHGYSAIPLLDASGTASKVANPRGSLPDIWANRFAAVAAGLGELGWNGLLLTPEYGPRQRILSIVTDAPLEPTPMYDGPPLCDRCIKCVEACPVKAISPDKKVSIRIGDRVFEYGERDCARCDWAKRYALVGEEGPKYMGVTISIKPPRKITQAVIKKVLKKVDPTSRHGTNLTIVEGCLCACMSPHLRHSDLQYSKVYRRRKGLKVVK